MSDREFDNINGIKVCDQTARDKIPTKTSQLENDSDYATITQVNQAIDNAQLGGGEVDLRGYVTKETGNASQITFADGQTFQAKLDAGILKGEKGDKGDTGPQGIQGEQGPAGVDGQTPNITIGTVTTLVPGSNATAEITGATPNLTLNLGIPKGATGASGTGSGSIGNDSKYVGKVMDCLGDSITARNVYQGLIQDALGFNSVLNHGIGNTCVSGTGVNAMWQDVRINALDSAADVVLFTGGTNDWQYNNTLGDIASTDTNTFYGACKKVLEKLITKYPNKLILTATPIWGKSPNLATEKNGQGYTIGDYAKALQECSRYYCIPCADVYSNCGFNDLNKGYYFGDVQGTSANDYIHPNQTYGHPKIANCIIAKLKELDVVVKEAASYGNLVISTNTINATEGGSSSFTINLDSAPSGSQGVDITVDNDDVTLGTSYITFNSTNYNTSQEITINIKEDADNTDDIANITINTITGSQTITVNIKDNDEAATEEPQPGDNLFNTNSKIVYRSGRTQSGASYTSDNTFTFTLESGNMAAIVVPASPNTKYKLTYESKTGIQENYGGEIYYYSAEPTYVQHDEPTLIRSENWAMGALANKYREFTTPDNCTWAGFGTYANSTGDGSITALTLVQVIE